MLGEWLGAQAQSNNYVNRGHSFTTMAFPWRTTMRALNLPQELLDYIVDFAAVECGKKDLYACSLAGWPFLIRSRKHLFRHVQLRPYSENSTLGLLRALEADLGLLERGKGWTPLASCIRSLELIPCEWAAPTTIAPNLDKVLKYLSHVEAFKLNFENSEPLSPSWSLLKNGLRSPLLTFCSMAQSKIMTLVNISDFPPQIIYSCSGLEHLKLENTYRPLPLKGFLFSPKDLPAIQFLEIEDESLDLIASSTAQYPELLQTFSSVLELETDYALRLPNSTHLLIMSMAGSLRRLRLTSTLNYIYSELYQRPPAL
ncbi:hypothetical protein CPB83DRAFT_689369 [Crepidotus variabilis]|uniref:Uncharacterized protein n=1 Tax=Crepidotus variabilis TaxID=179855 RepID=A0A9P6E6M5_9AGAR|nr:hypothetical protein CPB83DRAFT_689369 [Crepidotus variabilis]